MVLMTLFALLSSQPAVIGTDGDDLPVAARLLDDGTIAVVLQTFHQNEPMSYGVTAVNPGDLVPEIMPVETGFEDPLWTSGCAWISDSSFTILLSSADGQNPGEILVCTMDDEPSVSARFAVPPSPSPGEGMETGISSLVCAFPDGFLMTSDSYADGWDDFQAKTLFRLGPHAETIWSAEVPCSGWWMNPDLIRTLPDGGCAVASDEDGFSETLFLSRFSATGERLWSMEYTTGGEMTHHMMELLPAPAGGLLAVGVTDLFTMRDHAFILLVDSTGTIVSETVEDGPGNLRLTCGLALPDGRFLLAGWTSEAGEYPMDRPGITDCLVTVDAGGAVEALTTLSGSDRQPCFLLPDGNGVVLVGMMPSTDSDGSDVYVERLEEIP